VNEAGGEDRKRYEPSASDHRPGGDADDGARIVRGRRLAVEHDLDRALDDPGARARGIAEHRQPRHEEDRQRDDEQDDVEIPQDEHQRSLRRPAPMTMPATAPANTPAMPSGTAAPTATPTPNPITAPSTIAARSRLPATAPRIVGLLGGSVIGVAVG